MSNTTSKFDNKTFEELMQIIPDVYESTTRLTECLERQIKLLVELKQAIGQELVKKICDVINRRRPGATPLRVKAYRERPDFWPVRLRYRYGSEVDDEGKPVYRTRETTVDKLPMSHANAEKSIEPFRPIGWYEIDCSNFDYDRRRRHFTMHADGRLFIDIDTPIPTTDDELLAVLGIPALPAPQVTNDERESQPQPAGENEPVRARGDEGGRGDGQDAAH